MQTTPQIQSLVAGLVILSSALAAKQSPPIRPDAAYELATQAYHFAYPLVLMERTRAAAPNRPTNQFVHAPAYPGPDARTVVRPNVDTLYFSPNEQKRYAIGDRDRLTFNDDGSLDVSVQHARPAEPQVSNWLPAPDGDFNLTMRLYWPKPEVLSGQWAPPSVRRVP